MRNLRFDIGADGIGVATLDMPGRPFNVFSDDMIDELGELISRIEDDATLRGVVITSGKDAFMAGADLAMVQGFTTLRFERSPAEIRAVFSRLTYTLRRLERLAVTTVAAINGLALGGGLELAMACHYRIAARHQSACLGLPEVLLGLLPGAGGTQRLPRLTTPAFAARVLLGGQPVTPVAALEAGLVDALAEPAALLHSACEMARHARPGARWDQSGWHAPADAGDILDGHDAQDKLTALASMGPRVAHLYPAVGAIVHCLRDGFGRDIDSGIEIEIDNFLPLMLDPVAGNMVRTSFLSKTAAPKRAAARIGVRSESLECIATCGPVPARISKRFTVIDEPSKADACLIFGAAPVEVEHEFTVRVCRVDDEAPADCAAELRVADDPGRAEFAEIAGTNPAACARALAIANRLRVTPVVASNARPGPSARLLGVVRNFAATRAPTATARAAIADALDLGTLFTRAGLTLSALAGFTDLDRVHGHALLGACADEAVRILDDGLLASAAEVDVLAVVGLGFPAWSGGPLSYLDMLRRGELPGVTAVARQPVRIFYSN